MVSTSGRLNLFCWESIALAHKINFQNAPHSSTHPKERNKGNIVPVHKMKAII